MGDWKRRNLSTSKKWETRSLTTLILLTFVSRWMELGKGAVLLARMVLLLFCTTRGLMKLTKILNSEDLSTFCQACAQYNNDNVKLSTIAKRHACAVHHTGSAEK